MSSKGSVDVAQGRILVTQEVRSIAELTGAQPSPTYFGAADRLINESLQRARGTVAD